MKNLKAIHINWTRPIMNNNSKKEYSIPYFELLCTILSALLWRKNNGSIKLYTDEIGYQYYKKLGLDFLWDDGIDIQTLENIPSSISPTIYWAAAKLFALQNEPGPITMLDTDLLVWKNLTEDIKNRELVSFHKESLEIECYPSKEKLKKRKNYQYETLWNWTVDPYNTAICYFANDEFKKYYTNSAIDFMQNNDETPNDYVSQMVFAEQRLISMCANKMYIEMNTFIPDMYDGNSNDFTHLWGAKNVAYSNNDYCKKLCDSLLNAIHHEFPFINL